MNTSFIHFIYTVRVMPSWQIHKEKYTNLCTKLHNAGWLRHVIPCLLLPLKWCIVIKKTSACNGICPIRHKLTASHKLAYFLITKITVLCPYNLQPCTEIFVLTSGFRYSFFKSWQSHLVKKFPIFCGTWTYPTFVWSVCFWTMLWAR